MWLIDAVFGKADPAVRRISKPNPDPTYPAYAVGNADSDNEATRVAGCGHRTEIMPESVGGLALAGNFDRGASGSEAGGTWCRKTVTAAGEGDRVGHPQSRAPQ